MNIVYREYIILVIFINILLFTIFFIFSIFINTIFLKNEKAQLIVQYNNSMEG